jgi:hypothetical protein
MADLSRQIRQRLDSWTPAPFEFSFPEDWTEEQRDKFRAEFEDLRINGIPEGPRRAPRSSNYTIGCPAEFQPPAAPATPEEIEHWQQAREKLLAEGAAFRPLRVLPPGPLAYPGFEQMRDAILAALELHKPKVDGECAYCVDEESISSYGELLWYHEDAPCPTVRVIAEKLGIGASDHE